jgi:hypothetical protein
MDYNSSVTKVLVPGQGSLRYTGDHAGLPYWQFERELKRYLALRLHEPRYAATGYISVAEKIATLIGCSPSNTPMYNITANYRQMDVLYGGPLAPPPWQQARLQPHTFQRDPGP